ncbi:conserved Plasmodium protein, unknown function [Plasmodium reichenowi]|uniref:IMS import disulfide relay-system CHCH-CHCH-like Cx9C domain-containing protein n=12 Tax=Plasmodium (Laverania) TaxID=418107 RepID=Q8IKF9_PLAF7|nr:conserved Plasmodium protein, unknown function [Plasmodium falciparum 3D7]XP_012765720.1 hypothetical protein PRSY57_1467000 [Plasmodium reichenowi]EUR62037.1 hypothetical protein PFBG_05753 [Plasmodium falciparum 7G8]KAF4329562.1 hypothetical protein CYL21_2753 [Plasmodium falciparum NF54]SOS81502.1 conserved Plasmodium protein, unknown function [Plasmodium sp. gorilla clade G1]SPJ13039.1 conserved Plasmodium protein, unknown function [Plasmodium sp. DRC-Itaito]KYN94328.1 hypothetical pro|eukprot:XP_001348820.2 conserved Plasmodium protein, unknown function [Plasmodium falciparum 3D7]
MNMFTARKDFNDYKICMQSHLNKDIAKEKCELKLYKAINSTSHIISRECLPYTEDLQKCFKHSFRLSFCDKEIMDKLKTCQSDVYNLITS